MITADALFQSDLSRNKSSYKSSRIYLWCYRRFQCGFGGMTGIFARIGIIFFKFLGVHIATKSVGGGLRMPHLNGIFIHANAVLGENCVIFQQVTIGVNEHRNARKPPRLGNRVYVGAGAKLIGDICIGDDVRIGANAVVTKDVPSGTTVVGYNKVFKNRE